MAPMNTDNLATKDDLHSLESALKSDMQSLEGAMKEDVLTLREDVRSLEVVLRGEMKQMKDSLNEGIDRVLTVLVNMDKRLTPMVSGHEKRIGKLEKHAGMTA